MTIGSYNSIVVPLCHCFCKTLILSVSIYNIQITLKKQTMKEFLKFKSVGGGSAEVAAAGTYYLPIDNILMCEPGGAGLQIWQNAVATAGGASGGIVRYYTLELSDGTLENETAIAFNQALAANPGGKAIELQLPVGQTITSWQFQDNGII